jgi:hypothetical protein
MDESRRFAVDSCDGGTNPSAFALRPGAGNPTHSSDRGNPIVSEAILTARQPCREAKPSRSAAQLVPRAMRWFALALI